MLLDGTVAVVTGAQQGIGESISRAFVAEGASVVVNYLDDADAAARIVDSLVSQGGRAVAARGDVSSRDDVESLLSVAESLGNLNVWVNNAAIFPRVPLLEMRDSEWDELMNVNLRGSFLGLQCAAKKMIALGGATMTGGSIINISSRAAFMGSPRGAHYVTSKAGVIGLTRAAALELAPHRIRVNAIAPGLTDTAQPRYGMSEAEIAAAGAEVPLGRVGQPEDIAKVAVFLASAQSAFMTGQTLHANGGQYLA